MNEDTSADQTIRATLDLRADEPLRGSITLEGVERPFVGWLELANALTEMRQEVRYEPREAD